MVELVQVGFCMSKRRPRTGASPVLGWRAAVADAPALRREYTAARPPKNSISQLWMKTPRSQTTGVPMYSTDASDGAMTRVVGGTQRTLITLASA
jgi:hypothetical protein